MFAACCFAVSAALLVLVGGMYIGLYNDLAFDDIARKFLNNKSVFGAAKAYYLGETGRFTNGLITQHSDLYELTVYRSLHIILAIIWVASLFMFLKSFFQYFRIEQKNLYSILLCSLLVLVMIANAPNLSEWWFWYTTASLYMFGASLLLLAYYFILSALEYDSKILWWLSGVVIFFAAGSNEMVMFVAISITMIITLAIGRENKHIFIPCIFVLIGGLVVVMSPGTAARLETVSGKNVFSQVSSQLLDLPSGIMLTMLGAIKYWTKDIFWLLLLLLIAGFVCGCIVNCRPNERISIRPLLLLGVMLIIMVASLSTLVVLMDWKININDPSRTNNLAYFLFLLMVVLNSFYVGLVCNQKFKFSYSILGLGGIILLIISSLLIFISIRGNNVETMYDDIKFDKPRRQMLSILHWNKIIAEAKASGEKDIVVPNMVPANTLIVYRRGPAIDPNYAMNRYWKRYKGLTTQNFSRRNFDHLLLKSVRQQYQPINSLFNLQYYKDKFRNYLIVQIPERTLNLDKFCINLLPEGAKNYSLRLRDENFARLFFVWKDNSLCTDFVTRKVYCEPYKSDWFCRIPLPLSFSGLIRTEWGEVREEIKIN